MAARAPVGQLEGSWKTQLLHALGAVRPKNSIPRVWVDVGTSYKTLAKWDVNNNASLVVVGVDPVQSNIEHSDHPKTPRFVRVHGACAEGAPGFVTLNVHKSPTCASLHATRRDAPAVGSGRDSCTGDVPTEVRVPKFPLRLLLKRVQHQVPGARVELLKLDVQGAELACLRSAGNALSMVDNILLEVQDAPDSSKLLMYEGAPSLGALDGFLRRHGHERQYCEYNAVSRPLREVNCLYSNTANATVARKLWATANHQPWSSIVSYEALPRFVRPMAIVAPLLTSPEFPGQRVLPATGARGRLGAAPRLRPLH